MLINWFVVAAQIINFLILVLLLKRFLYGPIVQAMDAREARIASQLAAAQQKRQDAEQEEASLSQKIRNIEDQRQEMLAQAEEEAQAHKQKLFAQARENVEQVRQKWVESVKWQKEAFLVNLKQRLIQEFFAISRRVLQELGNLEVEQRLLEVFLERLRQLDPAERQALQDSIKEAGGELHVTSVCAHPGNSGEDHGPGSRPVRPGPGPALHHFHRIAGGHRDAHQFPQDRLEYGELPGHSGGESLPGL